MALKKDRKKVLAVTGIRSEYDILYPVLKALNKDHDFDLSLAVANAHLSDWHGFTLKKIEKDGFVIADKIDCLFSTNRKTQRIKGVGMLSYGLSQTVERINPDFLFVVGDREESISTALVGNYMDVLVAHLGGGDPVFGNTDDPVRMAVSKLAHIHFTMTQAYADNLIKMGEERFRVFNTGNPAFENIRIVQEKTLEEVSRFLDFDIADCNYIVLLKHPLSSEIDDAGVQMKKALSAVETFCKETGFKVVGIRPNTDPGAYDIINIIESYRDKPFIKFFKTLPRDIFINIMRNAHVLAGNSSMGILEAPFYRLPVINIGNRQQGRLNAGNVQFVGYDESEIVSALKKGCFDEIYRNHIANLENPYGDGYAADKIVTILKTINDRDPRWLVKKKLVTNGIVP